MAVLVRRRRGASRSGARRPCFPTRHLSPSALPASILNRFQEAAGKDHRLDLPLAFVRGDIWITSGLI